VTLDRSLRVKEKKDVYKHVSAGKTDSSTTKNIPISFQATPSKQTTTMISIKNILALLPLAIVTMAAPHAGPEALNTLEKRRCIPPSNCGANLGGCDFCCNTNIRPDSTVCHTHGAVCSNGTCDSAEKALKHRTACCYIRSSSMFIANLIP
jgi:hypothetical protein